MPREFGSRGTYGYLRMRGLREDRSLPSSGGMRGSAEAACEHIGMMEIKSGFVVSSIVLSQGVNL